MVAWKVNFSKFLILIWLVGASSNSLALDDEKWEGYMYGNTPGKQSGIIQERQLSDCAFTDVCYPLTEDGYLSAKTFCESMIFEKKCCCNIEILFCAKVCVRPCAGCKTPTPIPTSTSTATATPTKSPTSTCTPPPVKPPTRYGWFGGDPHIRTYDGLSYDCDACGEFIMSKKPKCPKYEIQSRFYIPTTTAPYSLVSDVVIAHENTCKIQVSLVRKLTTPHFDYLGGVCKIAFYIDGVLNVLGYPVTGHTFAGSCALSVDTTSNGIKIKFLQSGMEVRISFWNFMGYCAWGVQHLLPSTMSHSSILGLLGTPDSSTVNDWTDSSGMSLPIPGPPVSPTDGTKYCTTYWRLSAPSQSLFTYEADNSFDSIKDCVPGSWKGFPVRIATNVHNVDDICGRSEDCIKEYENGGEEAAIAYMNALKEAENYFNEFSQVA